ncbi:uncharacterized protein LOC120658406 isoform X1 [Panicum virgatum]|uniref:uncharacterized protein LOC120658406 isoform X1 n=1 Tax=Panicum virgatum TaxID=38727 RepID=UPI0019D4FB08|nr:uncharacterized protein LOC120658406 isoform X1 [Panicum virgatum]
MHPWTFDAVWHSEQEQWQHRLPWQAMQASERAAGAHQSWQQPWAGQCILLLRRPGRSAAATTTRSDPAGGSASRSEPRTDGSRRVGIRPRPLRSLLRCFLPAGRRRRTRRRGSVPATRSGGTGGCKRCSGGSTSQRSGPSRGPDGRWMLKTEDEDELYLDLDDEIRFLVSSTKYLPIPIKQKEDDPPFSPMQIVGSIKGDGLGLLAWWSADEEEAAAEQ